jgi:DNA (cytosine-5)-methyltransferase 1
VLTVLDLFSGIGGFSLGLERTGGFRTVAFCEIDPFCRKVLAKHWPGVPCFEDINLLTGYQLRALGIRPEVICGGFPCQDISSSGDRVGIEGARSGLWTEYARLIGETRPRLVLVENVAALNFRGLGRVLADLAALGYDAEWHVVPADALGAPHERERCWIIAYPPGLARLYQPDLGQAAARLLNDAPPWATCPWDAPASAVCGVDDGIPDRVLRTEKLGNAVVPQIPELIGRAILRAEGLTA